MRISPIFFWIVLFPSFLGIILLISFLFFFSDLELSRGLNLNGIKALCLVSIIVAFVMNLVLFRLVGKKEFLIQISEDIRYPKISHFIVSFLVSSILTLGLKTNLNYFLREGAVQQFEITIIDKYIKTGRVTDYYVKFLLLDEDFSYKIGEKSFKNSFEIGKTYTVEVKKGFFDGYFLLEPLE
jgi:hypothetical protein